MVASIKGGHIDLANRSKRNATVSDQSLLCKELIDTIDELLDAGCDESSLHALIENEFGLNSFFNLVLFDSSMKLRRLSRTTLLQMLYIRDDKFLEDMSAEINRLKRTISDHTDPKIRTKGRPI